MHKLKYLLIIALWILPLGAMETQKKTINSGKKSGRGIQKKNHQQGQNTGSTIGPKTYAQALGSPNDATLQITIDSDIQDAPKAACDEINNPQTQDILTTTPTQPLNTPPLKEAPDSTFDTPKTINFTGLGMWSGFKDTVWGPGPNLIAELNNNNFQESHPSNQGRIYQAIKYQINNDKIDEMATLFGLLAKLAEFKVENKEAMKIAYQYLKQQKMLGIECNAKKAISELIITNQKQLQEKVDNCKTSFGSQLPMLQLEIETILDNLNSTITNHVENANKCKQARLDCIALTLIPDQAGYDSDSDNKEVYSAEAFLKRKNINLYDTVESFKSNLADNKDKLQKIQDQFDAIKLAPAIENTK